MWYSADVLRQSDSQTLNYGELIEDRSETIPDFSRNDGWYETFDKIEAGDDYQYAQSTEKSKFIKKFRMWRVPVPRQERARMRNPWLRIKLRHGTKDGTGVDDKMVLRSVMVDSFY